MIINEGKQKEGVLQNEEVFLYKPYNISSESDKQKTPECVFIQEEIDNLLEKIENEIYNIEKKLQLNSSNKNIIQM